MQRLLLDQLRIVRRRTTEGEAVAGSEDPFEINPTLRRLIQIFMAKASVSRRLEEERWKSKELTENCGESTQQAIKTDPRTTEHEQINHEEYQTALRLASRHDAYQRRAEESDVALLSEMLIAREQTHTGTKQKRQTPSEARIRRTRETNVDRLSNDVLRRVMPEFLAAEKGGKVKIIATSMSIGEHHVLATRTLKLVMATFLEKSIAFHMPYPGLHIDSVADDYDEEKPLLRRTGRRQDQGKRRNEIRGSG